MELLSVGVPVLTGPPEGWNFWPLLGVPLALLIAFRWLRWPPRLWIVVIAIVVGLASADAISAWGVLPVIATTASIVAIASLVRRGGTFPRPPAV